MHKHKFKVNIITLCQNNYCCDNLNVFMQKRSAWKLKGNSTTNPSRLILSLTLYLSHDQRRHMKVTSHCWFWWKKWTSEFCFPHFTTENASDACACLCWNCQMVNSTLETKLLKNCFGNTFPLWANTHTARCRPVKASMQVHQNENMVSNSSGRPFPASLYTINWPCDR